MIKFELIGNPKKIAKVAKAVMDLDLTDRRDFVKHNKEGVLQDLNVVELEALYAQIFYNTLFYEFDEEYEISLEHSKEQWSEDWGFIFGENWGKKIPFHKYMDYQKVQNAIIEEYGYNVCDKVYESFSER